MGADYIEPDLVSTKDGYLIARHEPNIGGTTDVEDKFPSASATAIVDGGPVEDDWFASDFTLKEIRTLRAVQPLPAPTARRSSTGSSRSRRSTRSSSSSSARAASAAVPVGVYPETKHPTYHQQLGLPLEREVVDTLKRHGLDTSGAPVIIQSFEQANLRYLNRITPVTLLQLVDAWDVNLDGSLVYDSTSTRPV